MWFVDELKNTRSMKNSGSKFSNQPLAPKGSVAEAVLASIKNHETAAKNNLGMRDKDGKVDIFHHSILCL